MSDDERVNKIYQLTLKTFDYLEYKIRTYNTEIHGISERAKTAYIGMLEKYRSKITGDNEQKLKDMISDLINNKLNPNEKLIIKDLYKNRRYIDLINKLYNISKPVSNLINYSNVRLLLWWNKLLTKLIQDVQRPLHRLYTGGKISNINYGYAKKNQTII